MPAMFTISGLGKSYGAQTLFTDASIQFRRGARYGIVGANGSGKSTLLKIIAGEEEAGEGSVSIPKKARVGVLEQDHFQYENVPILDVVMMGNQELWQAMEDKEALLSKPPEEFDAELFGEYEDIILRNDGYSMEARAAEILEGLSIPGSIHREPLSVLSGGYKLRALLAQTLASEPDILLLDEPSNHLDILSIRWLEKFLDSFRGCAVIVSHDHRFLNNICTHIIDVDYQRVMLYTGNYNDFVKAKAASRERMESEIKKRRREIEEHKSNIERFKAKATKARQAQSKQKLVDKIVIEELPESSRRYPNFQFKARRPSGKVVVEVKDVSKSYGDNRVLENVCLTVQRGDRLAVIGPNGIGKSTLLKIIMGRVEADAGSSEWGYEAVPGYFAQDHGEVFGDERKSIEAWLWDRCPDKPIGFVRGHLARVLFGSEEVDKRLSALSGGEAARLVLASLSIEEPTVLVLDEPTNHLDLEGIEALVEGLRNYDGTIIFVSHDRWFVGRLATRILEIRADGMEDFPGTYDEYLAHCGDDHLDVDAVIRKARREKRS